jgi:hypothetical protein
MIPIGEGGLDAALPARASAIQLGTTIWHVGIAGSNPLAPTKLTGRAAPMVPADVSPVELNLY